MCVCVCGGGGGGGGMYLGNNFGELHGGLGREASPPPPPRDEIQMYRIT